MSDTLRVFVNGASVDVQRGATALDAVRLVDAAAAAAVQSGAQIVTDSRGLPTDAGQAVSAGAIFRLVPKRDRARPADDVEEL